MNIASKLRHLEDPVAKTEAGGQDVKNDAEILIEAVVAMSETDSIEEIGFILCQAACDLSGAGGSSFVVQEGDQCLYVAALVPPPFLKGQSFPQHDSLARRCLTSIREVVIADLPAEECLPIDGYRSPFFRSLVMVPVGKTDPHAVISAYWEVPQSPLPEKVRLLHLLAAAADVAIRGKKGGLDRGDRSTLKDAEKQLGEVNAHLDQLVGERTSKLEIANAELDAFAKTLSHDLKNPIAVIETNCWFIRDQCQDSMPEAMESPLLRIESTAKRMRDQIADMVALYHLSQETIVREKCYLSEMVKDISDNLGACEEQTVRMNIQEGLVDSASSELLRSALENLLSNAFKYSAKRKAPQVDFGAEVSDRDGLVVYHVRDNGVGFAMAQADRLFGLFQRLHSSSQFEGNGVGLASTKRIIQNHGGKIWAESEANKGATFYFTLHSSSLGG